MKAGTGIPVPTDTEYRNSRPNIVFSGKNGFGKKSGKIRRIRCRNRLEWFPDRISGSRICSGKFPREIPVFKACKRPNVPLFHAWPRLHFFSIFFLFIVSNVAWPSGKFPRERWLHSSITVSNVSSIGPVIPSGTVSWRVIHAAHRCLAQEFTHGAQEQQGLAFCSFFFSFSFLVVL